MLGVYDKSAHTISFQFPVSSSQCLPPATAGRGALQRLHISSVAGAVAFATGATIINRDTNAASVASAMVSRTNTARMLVAPRMPLTIGLNASPVNDAVVSNPKPAPRPLAGMPPLAAV